jgi:Cu/Ag efflux protein CusF
MVRTLAVTLFAVLLGALGVAGLAISGCSDGDEAGSATTGAPETHEYAVRGEITQLPDAESGKQLRIHHEQIPTFISRQGELVGMNEMTMDFPLGEGVDISGFEVGDKVSFIMVVDWNPAYYITSISKLPPETELFGPVAGPAELGG